MAADANSVQLAYKHLTTAIDFIEANNITSGRTTIIIYRPKDDMEYWYENLKSAQIQLEALCEKENLTVLEESNALMKLRETILDDSAVMISFYPNHFGWFWSMALIWLL